MYKKIISLVFICWFHLMTSQRLIMFERDTAYQLYYAGGDEFNNGELNTQMWHNGSGGRRLILDQDMAFNEQFVMFDDGNAVFKCDRSDSVYVCWPFELDSNIFKRKGFSVDDRKFKVKYEAGGIRSKQKVHYGVYELRFKTEDTKGVWPAYWFYGGKANEEIDAFELKGERGHEVHVDTHCPYGCGRGYTGKSFIPASFGGWMKLNQSLSVGYSVMHLVWREHEVMWLLNGKPLAYFKGSFSHPMYLFINTQVARDGGAFDPGPDSTSIFPNHFYVDYIRFWNFKDTLQKKSFGERQRLNLNRSQKFNDALALQPMVKRGLMYHRNKFKNSQGLVSVYRVGDKMMATVSGIDYKNAYLTITNQGSTGEVVIRADGVYTFDIEEQHTLVVTLHQKKKKVMTEVRYKRRRCFAPNFV